jgi:hypothetical protein
VPEETGSGREMEVLAGEDLAAVRLQVGIHEFAGKGKVVSGVKGLGNEMGGILVVALELLRLVLAAILAFPWAVVESIGLSSYILIQWMIPGSVVNLKTRTTNHFEGLIRGF